MKFLLAGLKAARPRPASPDLARPHLIGVVGCGWVHLGAVGHNCDVRVCLLSVFLFLFVFLPSVELRQTTHILRRHVCM